MNRKKVELVFRKDWLEISRNRQVLFPLVVLPLVFAMLLPLAAVAPTLGLPSQVSSEGLLRMMRALPLQVRSEIAGMTGVQAVIYMISVYLFAPVFLIIPIMASSVIASDSFAGEKERKTIEALLATPLSDAELLLGKMLVSFLPAFIVTAAAFTLYSFVIDFLTINLFNGRLLLPNPNWIIIVFALAPALAFADIGLTVLISARTKGVREAQQISALLLIPILAGVLGQASGFTTLEPSVVIASTALLLLFDVAVFVASLKTFGRDKILSRL
jgi:ABC-2 type transport system permease protein